MASSRFPRLIVPSAYFLVASSLVAAPPETRPVEGLREHPPAVHAFVHATIIPVAGEKIADATLVTRDGVIEAVGPKVAVPPDARVWDLQGKTIYPGFIDGFTEVPVTVADGGAGYWNSLVTPELNLADRYQVDSASQEKLRQQGFVARLVAPNAGVVKGTSVLVTTGTESGDRQILRGSVAQHVRLGVPRTRSRGGYPSSPMGAVALARQAFLDADWYTRAWSAHRASESLPRPERNDALAALSTSRNEHHRFIFDGPNEFYFLRADAFAREFALDAIIRGSGQEYQRLDAVRATGRAILLPVNFPRPPVVNSPEAARDVEIEDLLHWDLAPENPGRLQAAGITIAFTSDGLRSLDEYLSQIRVAVERGLPADAALRALTATPAELFGVSEKLGSLAVGKGASFVVTDGDLFDKKTKIEATWIDGVRYEIQKAKPQDVRGTWELVVTDREGKPQTFEATIRGTADKLEGVLKIAAGDKPREVKIDKLQIRDRQLTGTLPVKGLNPEATGSDAEGVVQFSGVLLAPPEGPWTLSGTVLQPDGSSGRWTGVRKSGPDKQAESAAPMKEAGSTAKDADPPAAATDAAKSPSDAKPDAKKAKSKKKKKKKPSEPETKQPAEAEGEKKDAGEKKVVPAVAKKASFPVNFPLGAFGRVEPPAQPRHVLFKNATIWTSGPAGTLAQASLLVTDGKIAAIGESISAPPDAVVIDATGKHLSPGIIDCHSHMATDGGVNEGTQAITAEVRIGDFIDANDIDIYRQLAGGVTSSNILHGSANPIGGQNQVIKLRWGALPDEMRFAEAPAGIKFALGENVKRSNFTDESTRYPQSRMGVEQIIRDAFHAAQNYRAEHVRWERDHDILPPRRDLELEALVEILEGKRWVHCHSYRQDEILALLRTCEDFGIQIATLQHILEGYKVADAISRHGAMGSSFSDWWAYKIEVYDAIPYNGAVMHNAGVVVSFNSDDAELARHLNHEAAKAMKYGAVAPDDALRFVTLNPARQLRIDTWVGSLEVGKHADLVVWSGPPLALTSRCEQTWIDGRKYFDRPEDQQRRQESSKIRATLVQKILGSGQPSRSEAEAKKPDEELWPRIDIYCRARATR